MARSNASRWLPVLLHELELRSDMSVENRSASSLGGWAVVVGGEVLGTPV